MVIDRIDRWTEKALALLDSKAGREIFRRNKYEWGLNRKENFCGIIQKACGAVMGVNLFAVYDRVEAELAARKAAWQRRIKA
ncbi:MAG: hypothetical protein LBD37_03430 [Treponema sp.]|jgi:hypothetical protein|nr:hypothetical protein [Treponema sp.]